MRPLRTPTHSREDNIKIYLKDIGCEGTKCVHLAQDSANIKTTLTFEAMLET